MRLQCKRVAVLSLIALYSGSAAISQHPQSPSKTFNEFRNQILSDFAKFKNEILDHYADFLNGEWHEFEPLIIVKEETPKPIEVPKFEETETNRVERVKLPTGNMNEASLPGNIDINSIPQSAPKKLDLFGPGNKSNYEMAAMKIPDPGFRFGPYPDQAMAPSPGDAWIEVPDKLGDVKYQASHEKITDSDSFSGSVSGNAASRLGKGKLAGKGFASKAKFDFDKFKFDFYGMTANIPDISFEITENLSNISNDGGAHWNKLNSQTETIEASRQLFGLAQQMGLNGYLTYRLAEHYVAAKFPSATEFARISTVHYLLSQMGYDMHLAMFGKLPVIEIPVDQNDIYNGFRLLNTNGYACLYFPVPYGHTFADMVANNTGIRRPNLPETVKGKTTDLRLTGLNIPMKSKPFEITGGGITLKGEVNENFMKMVYEYPQMPMGDFASSWIDLDLRKDLLLQVRTQLAGVSEQQAVNKLMSFFHRGFDYATDQDNHGFEKPYFLEENLYYDKNDCEDRAMFFSYLVWNALNLPCQLLNYPGHESAAVASREDVNGYFYENEGIKFYSADPTYEGSRMGAVMPAFRSTNPKIDKVYK